MDEVPARRLATIFLADIEGFSRQVGYDEDGAVERLRALQTGPIESRLLQFHGRRIKNTGDGFLAEFPSVIEAVRCGLAIQSDLRTFNSDSAPEKCLSLRIGINLGDVIVDGDDILGDGVNVAARLEQISEPGCVYISDEVHRHLNGRVNATISDLGLRDLKNINRKVHVYSLSPLDSGAKEGVRRTLPLPAKPSIAVLPFLQIGADADQEYFADAIADDITTALSKWRWFFVIARDSSYTYKGRHVDVRQIGRELGVKYLLQGSTRKIGARVRINVSLIDAEAGTTIWANSFEGDLRDIVELQDNITRQVVTVIEPELQRHEGQLASRRNINDLNAFDCCQRGMWAFNKMSQDGYHEAIRFFKEALSRDSQLTNSFIGLARTYYAGVAYGWTDTPNDDLTLGLEAAENAITSDNRDALGHYALSGILLYLDKHNEAHRHAERAIELNPNFALSQFRLGQILHYSGKFRDAIRPIESCMRLSPYDPQLGGILAQLALSYFHSGDFVTAARHAEAAADLKSAPAWAVLAASLERLGEHQRAQAALAGVSKGFQERFQKGNVRLISYANPDDQLHFFEALYKAGLPAGSSDHR